MEEKHKSPYQCLIEVIPALQQGASYPIEGSVSSLLPVSTIVLLLNDAARWSREEIADWLESLDLDLSFPVESGE